MQEPNNQQAESLTSTYTGLDALLDKVGSQGLYQKITFVIFSLQWFCIAWLLTGGGFFFDSVDFKCDKLTDQAQCKEYVCSLPESEWASFIAPDFPQVIANSFGTIYACDKDYVLTVLSMLVYIGSFFGFFVFPYIADNFGRKIAINLSWGTSCVGVIIASASQNIYMMGVGWFLGGFGGNPAITLSYSFINQQCLGKSRQYYSVGIQLFFAVGQSIIGFVFKGFGNWRPITFLLIGIFVATGLTQIYLIETPKFMVKKSLEKTLIIYNTIAKRNKRPTITMQDLTAALQQEPVQKSTSSSIIDLFRFKSLRWTNQICGLIFFAIQVVYYSTSFNLDSVAFDPYINQLIVGISEFFGYLFSEIIIPKIKRKTFSYVGMGLSGALCFILISVQGGKNAILSAILLCGMRFFLCSFWCVFYVYQAELFPTKVRSLSMGWSSAVGTIGSTMSPYIVKTAKNNLHISSWIIPGSIGILATFAIIPLKQTYNVKLQDDIQQQKSISRNSQITQSFNQ